MRPVAIEPEEARATGGEGRCDRRAGAEDVLEQEAAASDPELPASTESGRKAASVAQPPGIFATLRPLVGEMTSAAVFARVRRPRRLGAPRPERDGFDPAAGSWGALEFGARYSTLDLNDRAAGVPGGRQRIWTVGFGWWPVEPLRLLERWQHVGTEDGEAGGRRFQAVALRPSSAPDAVRATPSGRGCRLAPSRGPLRSQFRRVDVHGSRLTRAGNRRLRGHPAGGRLPRQRLLAVRRGGCAAWRATCGSGPPPLSVCLRGAARITAFQTLTLRRR